MPMRKNLRSRPRRPARRPAPKRRVKRRTANPMRVSQVRTVNSNNPKPQRFIKTALTAISGKS